MTDEVRAEGLGTRLTGVPTRPLAAALAICSFGTALAAPQYAGPQAVKSETHGPLALRQDRVADLLKGEALLEASCGTAETCNGIYHRHVLIPAGQLARLRALAIATRDQGLFDQACVARREKRAEAGHREQADPRPSLPPLPPDPVWSNLTVEGVGTVTCGPDIDSFRADVNCVSAQAKALWSAIDAL